MANNLTTNVVPITPSAEANAGILEIMNRLGCTKTFALDFAVCAALWVTEGVKVETTEQGAYRLLNGNGNHG